MVLDLGGGLFKQRPEEPKEKILTLSGYAFVGESGDSWTFLDGGMKMGGDNQIIQASAFLPHNVTITSAVCFGSNVPTESWFLLRTNVDGGGQVTLGTAFFNVEDKTIANAVVDNYKFVYHFLTSSLDTNDVIEGAQIIYTTSRKGIQK